MVYPLKCINEFRRILLYLSSFNSCRVKETLAVFDLKILSNFSLFFFFYFSSRFAAKTVHSGSLVLVTVELKESSTAQLIINTEKTVIGSVLLRELKPVLSQG